MFSLILIVLIVLLVVIVAAGLAVAYFARTKAIRTMQASTHEQGNESPSTEDPLNL